MSLRVATAMGKDSCLYYLNHRLMQIFTDDDAKGRMMGDGCGESVSVYLLTMDLYGSAYMRHGFG
jgi:hypothetical protein